MIIPTYRRDEALRRAIESALAQSYGETEVIVVDDSGEEYARSIVEEYDVEYVPHEENRGGNPARNTGYEAARGEYVQFLDDDDEILPEKVAKQVDLLEGSSSAGVAYGGIVNWEGEDVYPDPSERGRSLELALQFTWPTTVTSSLLISDEVLSEVYPLANRAAADDVGMKIELAKRTEFDFVDEVLTRIGDSVDSRSSRIGYIHEIESIYEEYEREYDRFPARVKRNARSMVCRTKGEGVLRRTAWSPSAIRLYLLAFVFKPGVDGVLLAGVVASCFGSPGMRFANWVSDRLHSSTFLWRTGDPPP